MPVMMEMKMALQKITYASSIGETLATLLQGEPEALRLWTNMNRDAIEFWLLTEPILVDTERHLYGIAVELHGRFPQSFIDFHLVNPRHFQDFDVTEIVPTYAEEIRLR